MIYNFVLGQLHKLTVHNFTPSSISRLPVLSLMINFAKTLLKTCSCSKTLLDFLLPKSLIGYSVPSPRGTPIPTKLVRLPDLEKILHIPASALVLMPFPCSPGLLSTNSYHHPSSLTHFQTILQSTSQI